VTRISTSVSINPEHKKAIERSEYGPCEFVQHAVKHGLMDGDMWSLIDALGEKEKEQFEAFANELQADADDLRADAQEHRRTADELDERADEIEARAERFTDLLKDTSETVEATIDEKRDDWKDAPDAEQTVEEAIDQLRNDDEKVEAEVLKDGPNNLRVESAAEKARVDPKKLASYAIDEIDPENVKPRFKTTTFPPETNWPPEWYVEADER